MTDTGKPFTVTHGQHYKATLKLSTMESVADDEMIKKMLEGFGFQQVKISGFGSIRHATGIWMGDTKTVNLDEHIQSVEEIPEEKKFSMHITHLEMFKVEPSVFND